MTYRIKGHKFVIFVIINSVAKDVIHCIFEYKKSEKAKKRIKRELLNPKRILYFFVFLNFILLIKVI